MNLITHFRALNMNNMWIKFKVTLSLENGAKRKKMGINKLVHILSDSE